MINLQDYTKQQRNIFFHNYEYFSNLIWSKNNFLTSVHKKLLLEVPLKYSQELWIIITHVSKCIKFNTRGYYISFTDHNYQSANKYYKIKITRLRMKELILLLEQLEYLVFYNGFYIKDVDSSLSIIEPTNKFFVLFNRDLVIQQTPNRSDELGMIEIVDTDKSNTIKRFNIKEGKMSKFKDIVLKDTRGIRGITEIRNNLIAYNTLLQDSDITIDLGKGDEKCNVIYKRRFEDTLTKCGRYYTMSTFQTIPSEFRPNIKINNEATIELDFKNCHPRLIADLENVILDKDFDCYSIPLFVEHGLDRNFSKSLLFPILFSGSRKDALSSVRIKLKSKGITTLTADDVLTAFTNHNSYMVEYFFQKELYQDLQYLDSSIATLIINYLTSKHIVVLCYHDSFIVQKKYKDELYNIMSDSYKEIISNNNSMLIV